MLYFDRNVDGPKTHALVIGVGHYRHMPGGAEERDQVIEQIGILKQLTSPPRSALAMADWLKQTADNWKAPVATVDLLISPAAADEEVGAPGSTFKPATINNIRLAYDEWKARCDVHEDDIAVFFFSGHGVEKSEHYLLAEDFGEFPNNPWLGAFAFDSTRRAFHSVKANTQCFFVDACRKVTSSMLRQAISVPPLDIVDLANSADCLFNLTMKAAAKNEAAHGEPRQASYFTQALRRALSGGVATRVDGSWQVESSQVSARIYEVLGLIKEDQRFPQRCTSEISDSRTLLETPNPQVRLTVECQPDEANAHAQLRCTLLPEGMETVHPSNGSAWQLDMEAGIYQVAAEFSASGFKPASSLIPIAPPLENINLDCAP